jgi:hypothetical protein
MSQKAVETKTQGPEPPTKPAPELKSLEVLVGKWRNDLEFKNNPENKGTGSITYEWLDGGFFLTHRFDQTFTKEGPHRGISIIGYDEESQSCLSHFFDNQGNSREYRTSIQNGIFKFTGQWERYTGEFSEDKNTITGTWEYSEDGVNWQYLCDATQTRL